ncbi:hypothetical protein DV738_g3799, partial [Chaetothyriales sp. CBS 135597]
MPISRSLKKTLLGRKSDINSTKGDQYVSPLPASGHSHEETAGSHQTRAPLFPLRTDLHYVQTQWTDNSAAADTIDSEDVRQSPNGPTRIIDNLNVQELDSEMSHTDESIYYMRSGRLRPLPPLSPIPPLMLPVLPVENNDTTPVKPAISSTQHPKHASLRNLSASHLRDRHYLETRLTTPQQALLATLQQAQVELRALELENDAVMDGLRMMRRRANMLQGELASRRIRNKQTKTSMDELRAEIDRQRTELEEERRKVEADLERFRRSRRRT